MNIRCCCDPERILGRVDLPSLSPLATDVTFRLKNGETLTLPIAQAHKTYFDMGQDVTRESEWALKSNDTPLEVLRQIPGFQEVNRVVPLGKEE